MKLKDEVGEGWWESSTRSSPIAPPAMAARHPPLPAPRRAPSSHSRRPYYTFPSFLRVRPAEEQEEARKKPSIRALLPPIRHPPLQLRLSAADSSFSLQIRRLPELVMGEQRAAA